MATTVYTAIFGGYDVLRPTLVPQSGKTICFSDEKHRVEGWEDIFTLPEDSPVRMARMMKMMPHILLPDADITVWIDGSVCPRVDLAAMADDLLGDDDIAMYQHPLRNCIYEEAKSCIKFEKDDPEIIKAQMARYKKDKFPRNFGLVASGILIRRNCSEINRLNEMWWDEISKGSYRDQLSFDYCRWKMGFECATIPGSIYSGVMCKLYKDHKENS